MTKPTKCPVPPAKISLGVCPVWSTQISLASAQSDQSLHCPHEDPRSVNLQAECGFLTCTVNFLKIWTPEKIAVINLKLEQYGFTTE